MDICKVCKTPIDGHDGYIHEFSFGSTLKTEITHEGLCAEIFSEELDQIQIETDDERIINESIENKFDDYHILW